MAFTRRHLGFTIIELLVVISIITLLIALISPNLGKSREAALRVQDASNLRQLGIGVTSYNDGNVGFLPTHFGGGAHPFTTYWINRSDQSKLVRVNLGLVLQYVPQPEAYYDVSLDVHRESALSYNGPDNAWNDSKGANPAGKDFRLRSSFPARSRAVEAGISGGVSHWKLAQYQNKVLYSCFTGVDQWNGGGIISGRILAAHHRAGNNALYADGSALWIPMAVLEAYRPVNSVTPSALDMHNWYRIMDEQR